MSIGVRKDNWAKYGKIEMSNDPKTKMATDVAALWYQAWGLSGIQEVFYMIIYKLLSLHCFYSVDMKKFKC